ncbi:MAG: hypothetical protein MJD61_12960 [Proteobacteria bacterium]|nr:hypothetical protein [Pseudomonadota bacterium]
MSLPLPRVESMVTRMRFPILAFGTPRKLPKPKHLAGRVVVLDIAFAAGSAGASFERTTLPFIEELGERLAVWVDHHDHVKHAQYSDDPRFVLSTKAEHGACPEMITPELVTRIGSVDTICCHTDFDGLCSAAKWMRAGREPYQGADMDAHAIDTRIGKPGPLADRIDRALRARYRDEALRGLIVRFLAGGALDQGLYERISQAADQLLPLEHEARRLAKGYQVDGKLALLDAREARRPYDKTLLLLLGQRCARVSLVHDAQTLTVAARFDSGIDLLDILGLHGGMPTVVSLHAGELERVVSTLRQRL